MQKTETTFLRISLFNGKLNPTRKKLHIHHLSQVEGTLFTTNKMKSIIGKDGCSAGADEILLGAFKPPPNLLTLLQTQYFQNLQWKNKIRPTGTQETIKIDDIKE